MLTHSCAAGLPDMSSGRRELDTPITLRFEVRSVLFVREVVGVCRHNRWRQQYPNKSQKNQNIMHHIVCLSRLKGLKYSIMISGIRQDWNAT